MTLPPAPAPVPSLRRNSHANLERILSAILEQPERFSELEAELENDFGENRAVLALDMSGFSRTVQRRGIVSFLLMIQQMRLVAGPAVEAMRGVIIKSEADNLICLFAEVGDAIDAAREIMQRLDTVNPLLPEDRRLYASIGIGAGHILNVEHRDLFGDEVNLACKLGEDVAERGDILLTTMAYAAAGDKALDAREQTISIAGVTLAYYALT